MHLRKFPVLLLFCFLYVKGYSQHGRYDTIRLGGIVAAGDTLPYGFIREVEVYGHMDAATRNRLAQLRYNVTKVYPYALIAADLLDKVDREMQDMAKKRDKKAYLKATERELNARFKDELKNLTVTQGKILVKLINRQTGRDCYEVIKNLKGGLNARMYQTVAFFFDNDLKEQYDPYHADSDIEYIVRQIEAKRAQRATLTQRQ